MLITMYDKSFHLKRSEMLKKTDLKASQFRVIQKRLLTPDIDYFRDAATGELYYTQAALEKILKRNTKRGPIR